MAIIGFIACTLFLLQMSAVALLFFVNGIGRFNIGGVPNSWTTKVFVTALALVIGFEALGVGLGWSSAALVLAVLAAVLLLEMEVVVVMARLKQESLSTGDQTT